MIHFKVQFPRYYKDQLNIWYRIFYLSNTVIEDKFDDYCNYNKTCDEFYKNNGREPSFSEIMKLLNISNERATIARNCYQKYQLLDGCLDIEGDLSQYTVEDLVYSKIIRDSIRNMIQSTNLTFREQDIVIKRNGLQNEYYDGFHQPVILEDIASQYNISRQRVDQIYREALRKVKSNPRNIKEVSSR